MARVLYLALLAALGHDAHGAVPADPMTPPALVEEQGRYVLHDEPFTGRVVHFDGDTMTLEGQIVDGKREGSWNTWFSDGTPRSSGAFRHGVPHGAWEWWFSNGQRRQHGSYVIGMSDGVWSTWDRRGNKRRETRFAYGRLDGDRVSWTRGGREVREPYVDGELTGMRTWSNRRGRVVGKEHYDAGQRVAVVRVPPRSGVALGSIEEFAGLSLKVVDTGRAEADVDGVSVAFAYSQARVDGIGVTLTCHARSGRGLSLCGFGWVKDVVGIQGGVFIAADHMRGVQLGVVAFAMEDLKGAQLGVFNGAEEADGVLVGVLNGTYELRGAHLGVFNLTTTLRGVQIGLLNRAEDNRGLQIGLVNFNPDARRFLKVTPLINVGRK